MLFAIHRFCIQVVAVRSSSVEQLFHLVAPHNGVVDAVCDLTRCTTVACCHFSMRCTQQMALEAVHELGMANDEAEVATFARYFVQELRLH